MQQANKVDKGTVVGVRQISVSAAGVVGSAAGAAAGGAVGEQAAGGGIGATFGAIGGGLLGGVVGSATEHAVDDTTAYEYIVRKPNGDLVSVTQKDKTPLAIGQAVLVIAGNQARIVPDYTVIPATAPTTAPTPPPPPVVTTPPPPASAPTSAPAPAPVPAALPEAPPLSL